jgi:Epiplasmin protein
MQREVVKGESRIEYIPYEKSMIEYEAVQRTEYVPKEKRVTDYYAVEYQTEYIP